MARIEEFKTGMYLTGINPVHVVSVIRNGDKASSVRTVDGQKIEINEDYKTVLERLEKSLEEHN